MLLAIDIGNTNIVVGLFRGDSIVATWRLGTDARRTSDEFVALMLTLLQHQGLNHSQVDAAIISSVVPPLTGTLEVACRSSFHVEPLTVGPNTLTGIKVLTDHPSEVGVDRVVNAIAAHHMHGRDGLPLIVIDFGTATKFDAVSPQGDFLGGAIAPGIGLAAEALVRRGAKLPRIDLTFPETVVGKNTVHAMQSGLMFGYLSLVEGIVLRMKRELGGEAVVITTGGLASVIVPRSNLVGPIEPDLTLHGLRLIHQRNHAPSGGGVSA